MPSKHQSGAGSRTDFESEPHKMLATKNDATIKSIVRGIRRPERARAYIQAEIDVAEEEDREPRKALIGMLNGKIRDLDLDADATDDGKAKAADADD